MNKTIDFYKNLLDEIKLSQKNKEFDAKLFLSEKFKNSLGNKNSNEIKIFNNFYYFLSKNKEFDLLKNLIDMEGLFTYLILNNWDLDEINQNIESRYKIISLDDEESKKDTFKLSLLRAIFYRTINESNIDYIKNIKYLYDYLNDIPSENKCVLTDDVFFKFLNNMFVVDSDINIDFIYICNDIFFDLIIKNNISKIPNGEKIISEILLELSYYMDTDKVKIDYINMLLIDDSTLDKNKNLNLIYNLLNMKNNELNFDIKTYVINNLRLGKIDYITKDLYLVSEYISINKNGEISKILLKKTNWVDLLIELTDQNKSFFSETMPSINFMLDILPLIEKEIKINKEKTNQLIENLDKITLTLTKSNVSVKKEEFIPSSVLEHRNKEILVLQSMKRHILDLNKKTKINSLNLKNKP